MVIGHVTAPAFFPHSFMQIRLLSSNYIPSWIVWINQKVNSHPVRTNEQTREEIRKYDILLDVSLVKR